VETAYGTHWVGPRTGLDTVHERKPPEWNPTCFVVRAATVERTWLTVPGWVLKFHTSVDYLGTYIHTHIHTYVHTYIYTYTQYHNAVSYIVSLRHCRWFSKLKMQFPIHLPPPPRQSPAAGLCEYCSMPADTTGLSYTKWPTQLTKHRYTPHTRQEMTTTPRSSESQNCLLTTLSLLQSLHIVQYTKTIRLANVQEFERRQSDKTHTHTHTQSIWTISRFTAPVSVDPRL